MSKISIQNEHGELIVGILEKKEAIDIGRDKPRMILIAHGVLGHKDYLFHRLLAETLPYTSFRFDFRGNGESTGTPGFANMLEDTQDLFTVSHYFENVGYEIFAVIGHSRGSVAGLKFATSVEKPLPFFVNVSGRYKMDDNQINTNRPEIGEALRTKGYFDWKVKQRDRIAVVKVTQKEVDKFTSWSNAHVSRMPMSTCVLTVHGLKDNIVPPYNAAMFANKIPNHTLVLVPEGDHNFKGRFEDVTKAIVDFFVKHEKDDYKRLLSMGQNSALIIPRWIDVDGVKNFRDVGGWPIKNGTGYIRERILFRSGHLANLSQQGSEKLVNLNVKAVFDFRLEHEIKRDGALKPIPGVSSFNLNLYENVIHSMQDLHKHLMVYLEGQEGFAQAYMVILESGKEFMGQVFRYMIKELTIKNRKSIIVHCTAGKDRTGLFVMTLLGLCGVDDDIIAREYELSNLGYFDYEKDLDKRAKQMGVSIEHLRSALSANMIGMKLAIKQLKQKYGSFEGYAQNGCGLSVEEINLIRELMVVPIRFEERQLYRPKI